MDTLRLISPWIVVAVGFCFAVYMALIDRRMRRLQTPHLDEPTPASGRTEDFKRRHIEAYIAGDISLDDLMEKLRRCGPPKAKRPSPPVPTPVLHRIPAPSSQTTRPIVESPLLDPFCGAGWLVGSSAVAAYKLLQKPPIRAAFGKTLILSGRWYRHRDGRLLVAMTSGSMSTFMAEDCITMLIPSGDVTLATPKAGEWWTIHTCAKHGYGYSSYEPFKWQCDPAVTVHMLDRVACGCVAPSNFGKGLAGGSAGIAGTVGPSGGSGIDGGTGPGGQRAGA